MRKSVSLRALDFAVAVIDVVDQLDAPRKHFRLIEQLEGSCTSVASNIAEGKGRFSKKEFKQYLYIARGSLYETVARLQILNRKHWLEERAYSNLYSAAAEINRMLAGLIKSIK